MPPEARRGPCVLVLESSPLQAALLRRALRAAGCEPVLAATFEEADALARDKRPALALVELLREGGNGFEDGVRLMESHGLRAVLMSASGRPTDAPWAERLGFAAVLVRPFRAADLRRVLAGAHPAGG